LVRGSADGSGNSIPTLFVYQLLNCDNVVIELACDGGKFALHCNSIFLCTLQAGSVGTVKARLNICSVQFLSDCARSIAIGSTDHKITAMIFATYKPLIVP
jgi:hypothetical protein